MTTDAEAEAFLAHDRSALDYSQFLPLTFECHLKTARVNMRLPQHLLDAIKARAAARAIPYQFLSLAALEQAPQPQRP
jgi:predicted DNA binding CopG/RHH family protein